MRMIKETIRNVNLLPTFLILLIYNTIEAINNTTQNISLSIISLILLILFIFINPLVIGVNVWNYKKKNEFFKELWSNKRNILKILLVNIIYYLVFSVILIIFLILGIGISILIRNMVVFLIMGIIVIIAIILIWIYLWFDYLKVVELIPKNKLEKVARYFFKTIKTKKLGTAVKELIIYSLFFTLIVGVITLIIAGIGYAITNHVGNGLIIFLVIVAQSLLEALLLSLSVVILNKELRFSLKKIA